MGGFIREEDRQPAHGGRVGLVRRSARLCGGQTKHLLPSFGRYRAAKPGGPQHQAGNGSGPQPILPGESPTTGLPWTGVYLPMLVQISSPEGSAKVNGATVKSAGIGNRAPWGGQYADVVYEGILYRTGETRISFLFSDSLEEGNPTSVGPVRSARIGHVLLREEWQSGFIYAGGPRRGERSDISAMFNELGASDKGILFDLLTNKWNDYPPARQGPEKTRITST